MTLYETRILNRNEAVEFLAMMSYLTGLGKMTFKKINVDKMRVTASRTAWNYWGVRAAVAVKHCENKDLSLMVAKVLLAPTKDKSS